MNINAVNIEILQLNMMMCMCSR